MASTQYTLESLTRPHYVIEERRLRENLSLIRSVADEAGVEFILALKAYALWKTFPIFREYIGATTASSLFEARLAVEEFGSMAHTYSPAYTDYEIGEIAHCSSHLTFNSLSQYARHREAARRANPGVSLGLRVNPERSEIDTALYDPCAPGSRFGVLRDDLPVTLPGDLEGIHVHCHCESPADGLQRTLAHLGESFAGWLRQVRWVNMGGGHLVTRKGYDRDLMIASLREFRERFPHLRVIMEPGSAFGWQTGTLVSQVVDIVRGHGMRTAILNVSFTCHMPDCLEMPYMPTVRSARAVKDGTAGEHVYRLGGNSCLSGDFMGMWDFGRELSVGDSVIFEDMLHYTTVKTNMFNGVPHPSLAIVRMDGTLETLREFTYGDYRDRMD